MRGIWVTRDLLYSLYVALFTNLLTIMVRRAYGREVVNSNEFITLYSYKDSFILIRVAITLLIYIYKTFGGFSQFYINILFFLCLF